MKRLSARSGVVRPLPRHTPEEGFGVSKDIALKAATAAQLRVRGWRETALARIGVRPDGGQTSVEYLGIIAVVAAIVLVLMQTGLGNVIYSAILHEVEKVVQAG